MASTPSTDVTIAADPMSRALHLPLSLPPHSRTTSSNSLPSPTSSSTSQLPTTPLSELTLSDSSSPLPSPSPSDINRDDEDTPTPGMYDDDHLARGGALRKDSLTPRFEDPHSHSSRPGVQYLDVDVKPPLQTSISAPAGSIVTASDLAISLDNDDDNDNDEEGPRKGFSFGTCPSAPLEPTQVDDDLELFVGTPTAEKGAFEYPLHPSTSSRSSSRSGSLGSSSRRSSIAGPFSGLPSSYASSSRRGSLAFPPQSAYPNNNTSSPGSGSVPSSFSRRSSIAVPPSSQSYFPLDLPRKPSLTRRSSSSASTVTSLSTTETASHTRRPSLHPTTATPTMPLPQASTSRRGSIMFQQKALPAPIPPSLLARRGSLPATEKIFGLPSTEKRSSLSIGHGRGQVMGESSSAGRRDSTLSEAGTSSSRYTFGMGASSPRRSSLANTGTYFPPTHPPVRGPSRRTSLLAPATSFPEQIPEVSPPTSDHSDESSTGTERRRSSIPYPPSPPQVHSGSSSVLTQQRKSITSLEGPSSPLRSSITSPAQRSASASHSPVSPQSPRTFQSSFARPSQGLRTTQSQDPISARSSSSTSGSISELASSSSFPSTGRGSLLSRGSMSGLSSSEEGEEEEGAMNSEEEMRKGVGGMASPSMAKGNAIAGSQGAGLVFVDPWARREDAK